MELVNKYNHTYKDVINEIKNLISKARLNPVIIEISKKAKSIENENEKELFIFDSIYNLAVFRASPENRQQLRTAENIIRTKQANCTGYTTLIGAVLENCNIPYKLRLVDVNGNGYSHIYIKTNNNVLDCILSQKQDNTESFENRQKGYFNYEISYLHKIDFPMITTINGMKQGRIRNKNINGFWDILLTPLLGDECNLQCNMKYASDVETRQLCKEACANGMTMTQFKQWRDAGGVVLPIPKVSNPNPMSDELKYGLIGGAGLLAIYFMTKKK